MYNIKGKLVIQKIATQFHSIFYAQNLDTLKVMKTGDEIQEIIQHFFRLLHLSCITKCELIGFIRLKDLYTTWRNIYFKA